MLKQKVTKEVIYIPFQKMGFFVFTVLSVIVYLISLYLMELFPIIGNFPIFILIVYFIPAIVAYDWTGTYKDSHQVPKLNHPKKFMILMINLLFGWTVIGWLVSLYMAFKPGQVEVERVVYEEVSQ